MRTVTFDFSQTSAIRKFGGYQGEHNETLLQVILPLNMQDTTQYDYLSFVFQTAEDQKIETKDLSVSQVITINNKKAIAVPLWGQLLVAGILKFTVCGKKLSSDKKEVSLVAETPIGEIMIGASATGVSTEKNDSIIYPDVSKLAQDMENKVDKIPGMGLSSNDFTNELKSELEGLWDAEWITSASISATKAGWSSGAAGNVQGGVVTTPQMGIFFQKGKSYSIFIPCAISVHGSGSYNPSVYVWNVNTSGVSSNDYICQQVVAFDTERSGFYLKFTAAINSGNNGVCFGIGTEGSNVQLLVNFGDTVIHSFKIDNVYTKEEVNNAISAAITTTLNTEV